MKQDTSTAPARLTAAPGKYLTQAGTVPMSARVFRTDILVAGANPSDWREVDAYERPIIEESDRLASLEARYSARLSELIHMRYTLDDEIALKSNLDDDPTEQRRREYDEYLAYRRQCKARARQEVYDSDVIP